MLSAANLLETLIGLMVLKILRVVKKRLPIAFHPPSSHLHGHGTGFYFDSDCDVHKNCLLCELMFPPSYDQNKFEEHVEIAGMCAQCSPNSSLLTMTSKDLKDMCRPILIRMF